MISIGPVEAGNNYVVKKYIRTIECRRALRISTPATTALTTVVYLDYTKKKHGHLFVYKISFVYFLFFEITVCYYVLTVLSGRLVSSYLSSPPLRLPAVLI